MAMSNAERQRRHKDKLKERATATVGLAKELEQAKNMLALAEQKLAWAEERRADAETQFSKLLSVTSSIGAGTITAQEYKKLLKCLHPDILQGIAAKGSVGAEVEKMYTEAFRFIKEKESALKSFTKKMGR
jgi:hypothetical protein